MTYTGAEYHQVYELLGEGVKTLDELRQAWLDTYGPRPRLTWWLRLVLANLCERSQASIRFDDARPTWSRTR